VFPLNCFPSLLQGIHKEEVLLLQLLQQHLELLQQHLKLLQQHLELLHQQLELLHQQLELLHQHQELEELEVLLVEVVEVVLVEVLEEGLVVEEDLEEHLLVLNLLLGEVLILQGLSLPQGSMVPQLLVLLLHQLMAHTLDGWPGSMLVEVAEGDANFC
jgi:hypothetical protein